MPVDILFWSVPGFLLLIIIELTVDRIRGTGYYRLNDAFGSLTLGIVSRTTQLFVYSSGMVLAAYYLNGWVLFTFELDNPWHWLITFVGYDLMYYWYHRLSHEINVLWASHVIHHQSEEYNLTTALRQTSTGFVGWAFSVPLLLLGSPVEMLATCVALNLLYQFWVHTRHLNRLGWLEWVMVTPSNHRVHHGQNQQYIDKNHGGVFIIWDRVFGTFQDELKEEPVIFGVRSATRTFDPIKANFQIWWALLTDAFRTQSWKDKVNIWFKPTGWRPEDVKQRYPVVKADLKEFEKFDPQIDNRDSLYAFFQLLSAIGLMVYLVIHFTGLSLPLVLAGFAVTTLPMVTTARILDAKGTKLEGIRLLAMWPLAFVFWDLMSQTSVYVFGSYLVINSLLYLALYRGLQVPEARTAN